MTTSTLRTVTIGTPGPSTYGTMPAGPLYRWVTTQPGTNLDYYIDATCPLAAAGDSLATVSLAISPSGTGELQALDLTAQASGLISVQLANATFAGRNYAVRVTATGQSGRVWVWLIGLSISPELAIWPLTPPQVANFGTPITWTSGATVFGPSFLAVAAGLVATGTNQATALVLPAQANIFASAPSGTGGILPSAVSGTFIVQDDDPANNLPIYPPVGAQINALGVNAPLVVGSNGGRISFSTQSPSTQWFAG